MCSIASFLIRAGAGCTSGSAADRWIAGERGFDACVRSGTAAQEREAARWAAQFSRGLSGRASMFGNGHAVAGRGDTAGAERRFRLRFPAGGRRPGPDIPCESAAVGIGWKGGAGLANSLARSSTPPLVSLSRRWMMRSRGSAVPLQGSPVWRERTCRRLSVSPRPGMVGNCALK